MLEFNGTKAEEERCFMLNTDKFIFLNKASYRQRRVVIEKGAIVFQSQVTEFSEDFLVQILKFSSQILEQKKYKCLPIYFELLKQIKFTDKLMYVLFECICYELIQKGHFVQVRMAPICQIITHGYNSSPLLLWSTGRVDHVKKFKKNLNMRCMVGILEKLLQTIQKLIALVS